MFDIWGFLLQILNVSTVATYHEFNYSPEIAFVASAASAKSTHCITFGGAIDAYAKAVQEQNPYYRLMCATEEEQEKLIKEIRKYADEKLTYLWESGLKIPSNYADSYCVYNLNQIEENKYTCLVTFPLSESPDGDEILFDEDDNEYYFYAYQPIFVQKEYERWVVIPTGDFVNFKTIHKEVSLKSDEMPGETYVGSSDEIEFIVKTYNVYVPYRQENITNIFDFSNPNKEPIPDLKFANANFYYDYLAKIIAPEEKFENMKTLSYDFSWNKDEKDDEYSYANSDNIYSGKTVFSDEKPGETIFLSGGGSIVNSNKVFPLAPKCYVTYNINGEDKLMIEIKRQEGEKK